MPVVTNTVKRPDGSAATDAIVLVQLVGSNGTPIEGFVTAGDYSFLGTFRPTVNSTTGVWSATLVANTLINPSGTRWKVTQNVDGLTSTDYLAVPDGAGPYVLEDILDDQPGSVASSALTNHLVDTVDAHDASAISFTPTGSIAASNVQDAIAEVASEAGGAETLAASIVDAKGDLIVATAADTPARLAVGTNGYVLTVDSTQSAGVKWAAPSATADVTTMYEGIPMRVAGHSYTQSTGTAQAAAWPNKVAGRLRSTLTNNGSSGTEMKTAAATLVTLLPATKGVVIVNSMINDVRLYGSNAAGLAQYKESLRTIVAAARATSYTAETDGACAYTGTWTTTGTLPNALGGTCKYTGEAGAYVDITFSGDEITLICQKLRVGEGGGTFTVTNTAGGATLGTISSASGTPAGSPIQLSPTVLRITGLGVGSHTIRMTNVSGSDNAFFDGFLLPQSTYPVVVVVKDQELNTYASGAPYDQGSDAAVAAYKTAIDELVAEYASGVVAVDVADWDKATMIMADTIHPNDKGQDAYANAIEAGLAALTWRSGTHVLA